jgi:uncharacterized protein
MRAIGSGAHMVTGAALSYPQPREDRDNREFLAAWQEGRLLVQACGGCGRSFFYPRTLCPYCWSQNVQFEEIDGKGEVVSFSLVHRPNHPAFLGDIPIVLAEIRLSADLTLIARIVGTSPEAMRSSLPVELVPANEAARYPLPTFRPRAS